MLNPNIFLFLTSRESPLNKGGSGDVWKYRWLPMDIGKQNAKLLETPLEYKDAVNCDIDNYVLWLNRLYSTGLAVRYKVELIKNPIQANYEGENETEQ